MLQDYQNPQDLLGESGLLKQLPKAIVERCLETETDLNLDYLKHARLGKGKRDHRNGHGQKTLKGKFGKVVIDVPRDRKGEFSTKR
ncbi:MAG: transposase [Leptolyngbyaceae cyanobacterium MO_188.B28]|nr:transposase [Leptolyngbyaceae cyanobacterium MO_188.B28]